MAHLKHGSDGNLLHGPGGNLVRACGSGAGCACADPGLPCVHCPDVTPTRFHVTFVDVVVCADCVNCPAAGSSVKMAAGSILNGTYVLTRNGSCAWTASSLDVPSSALQYAGSGCTGTSTPVNFAIQQIRISDTQFELQVTDASNSIFLFDATLTVPHCCQGYTVGNGLTGCGCRTGDVPVFTLAAGGTATVTPC